MPSPAQKCLKHWVCPGRLACLTEGVRAWFCREQNLPGTGDRAYIFHKVLRFLTPFMMQLIKQVNIQ